MVSKRLDEIVKREGRTESEDHAAAPGKDTHCANVLPSGRVLDAGREQTSGTGDHGALNSGLDSIYGVVVVIVTVGRHLRWGFGQGAGSWKDQLARLNFEGGGMAWDSSS